MKYAIGQEYRAHFDWFDNSRNPRISTMFAYLACDPHDSDPSATECAGGATRFPDYTQPFEAAWCDVMDCEDEEEHGGVAFKPIPGNAVFWSNIHPNGSYHEGTLHAGMPVQRGLKVGLNIWTRKDVFRPTLDEDETEDLEDDASA